MKKKVYLLLAVLALASCFKQAKKNDEIAGDWKIVQIAEKGDTIDVISPVEGEIHFDAAKRRKGEGYILTKSPGEEVKTSFTYKINISNAIIMYRDGDKDDKDHFDEATVSGNTLMLTTSGGFWKCEKK